MTGICYHQFNKTDNDWDFVLSHFTPDKLWSVKGDPKQYHKPQVIDSVSELPKDVKIVVCAHPGGRYIQGQVSLVDYEHPGDAIYLFGHDHQNLEPEELEGFDCDYVFVPSGKNEMYSYIAAAIVLYDRMVKYGR